MSNGFVKKFRTEKSKELKRKHTSAFLILDTVAENAKREIGVGHPLLEISEAIVTAEECGLSPQQFETGLKYLETQSFIEILHRGRRDKNSKIGPRIKPETTQMKTRNTSRINGTVLKLIDSSIYDINPEETPKHIPIQTRNNSDENPNKQEVKKKEIEEVKEKYTKEKILPFSSNEEFHLEAINQGYSLKAANSEKQHNVYYPDASSIESYVPEEKAKIRKGKKELEKKLDEERIHFREWVKLTQKEYDTLIQKHGPDLANSMLNVLDSYNTSRQEHYKSDYGALKEGGWVHEKALKQISESKTKDNPNSKQSNAEYAKEIFSKLNGKIKGHVINVGPDYLEFTPGTGKVFHLKFSESGFKDQVDLFLRKLK